MGDTHRCSAHKENCERETTALVITAFMSAQHAPLSAFSSGRRGGCFPDALFGWRTKGNLNCQHSQDSLSLSHGKEMQLCSMGSLLCGLAERSGCRWDMAWGTKPLFRGSGRTKNIELTPKKCLPRSERGHCRTSVPLGECKSCSVNSTMQRM